jgi:glycosyltransferase involved in cell wall biosynthesis
MQILFVHPNYPAQFGPTLQRLTQMPEVECVFVTRKVSGINDGVRCIPFELRGGATKTTHYCSRTFENAVWRSHAVYETCKSVSDLKPDLIVGHSGFGTTAMLKEIYDAPIINFFEYYYHPHNSDMDFRQDFLPAEIDFLRSRMRNAMILIDLETCAAGYCPTQWQHSLLPKEFQPKVETIHDGVDTDLWCRRKVPRKLGDEIIPDEVRIVTYVSRGFEAIRGFDIFMQIAKQISETMPNVLFICVGSDRICYGNDLKHIQDKSFREHVLKTVQPDLSCLRFTGLIPREQLADILSISDLHIYLTVPFVLSWSMLNALACECVVLASDTAPVQEFISHDKNGLLNDFFDTDGFVKHALRVLKNPDDFRHLGQKGRELIKENYSLDETFPKLWKLYNRHLTKRIS